MKLKFEPKKFVSHKVIKLGPHHHLVKPGDKIDCSDLDGYGLLATGDWKEVKSRSAVEGTTKGPEVAESKVKEV